MYGDKVAKTADVQKGGTEEENNPSRESDAKAPSVRLRGWFPRKCAVESAESAIEHRKASGKHRPNSSSGRPLSIPNPNPTCIVPKTPVKPSYGGYGKTMFLLSQTLFETPDQ